jgi:hypothetical protein
VTVLLVLGALAIGACGSKSASSPAARGSPPVPPGPAAQATVPAAGAGVGAVPPAASVSAQLFVTSTDERLRPGTIVAPADLGTSVFADARHGFTLASIDYRTYPAATIDGGRTWRIAGPVLPIPPAPGPMAGVQPGVAGPDTYFASEGLEGLTVVEVTTDAGKHWWQAFLPGGVVYVGAFDGELTAIIAVPTGNPQSAGVEFWAYHSRSGRRWDFDGALDSVSS